MKTYFYTCIHLPSQHVFARMVRCDTLREFYDLIVKWNAEQPKTWLYAPTGDDATT